MQKPSIALWGTADTDVPYRNHEMLMKHLPHCVLHTFEVPSLNLTILVPLYTCSMLHCT